MRASLSDPQCAAVYRAERDLFEMVYVKHIPSMRAVQHFVQCVIQSNWWTGPDHVTVQYMPGRRYADSAIIDGGGQLRLPRWAWTRPSLLHELSHLMTPRGQYHGPAFCRTLLEAHELFSSRATADALAEAFNARGVRTR